MSHVLDCSVWNKLSEWGNMDENIPKKKLKSKSLRRVKNPRAEGTVSESHSLPFSIIKMNRFSISVL
jgi:hypothetical protein